jgi:hypothetical protein
MEIDDVSGGWEYGPLCTLCNLKINVIIIVFRLYYDRIRLCNIFQLQSIYISDKCSLVDWLVIIF